MTFIRGIVTTPGTPIEGMYLQRGCFDCTLDNVPLLHRHEREVGKVLGLFCRGDNLHVLAETDDDVACKAGYFSPGFRVLEHRNGRVIRASLCEISVTGTPCNPACRILARSDYDPMVALWRKRLAQHDLTLKRIAWLQRYVAALPAALAALAPQPKPRGSFSELVHELNQRSQ